MKLGVITYDHCHLKTEQLVNRYARNPQISEICLFALPFTPRKAREVLFSHRPYQEHAIPTVCLSELDRVSFTNWDGREPIGHRVDLFVITGAGLLDVGFAGGKPIVNAHPGVIPTSRGLDSFKWAILENDPLGVTLHLIDNEVDKGDVLDIRFTPVFSADTLETVARRHYELELDMLADVLDVIDKRTPLFAPEKPAKKRMPAEKEAEMMRHFDVWKTSAIVSQAQR
ncbi:MAG: formyltransferase family protein [Pseudomonadota bacterium]